MTQYRKKPIVIDAFQFDGSYESVACVIAVTSAARWFGEGHSGRPPCVEIQTLEGTMTAMPGDWIIRGVKGEFYPCKPDIFAATYELPAAPAAAPAPPQLEWKRDEDGDWLVSLTGFPNIALVVHGKTQREALHLLGDAMEGAFMDACPDPSAHVAAPAPAQAEGWQQVTRLEVIDEAGRLYTRWQCAIEPSVQDQGRTLKLFVMASSAPDAEPE